MDGQSKTFDLYDVRCVRNYESFDSNAADPMSNAITLIPGILVAEGVLLRVQKWKIQDPAVIMGQVAPTVIEQPAEGKILSYHYEDKNGQQIDKPKRNQLIYLAISSSDMIGKNITIDLSDDTIDYEYNGSYIENDLLENIKVTADTMKIELRTLKQR